MKSHRQNVRHACLLCTWSIRRKMFEIRNLLSNKIVALSAEEIPTSNPPNKWILQIEVGEIWSIELSLLKVQWIHHVYSFLQSHGVVFLRPNLTNSALVHWHRFIIQLHKMGRTFWYLVMSSHSPHTEMFIIPIPNYQHHDLWRNDWPSICVDLRDSHADSHPRVSQWGGAATQIWHFLQYWG